MNPRLHAIDNPAAPERLADTWRNGGVTAFPTETVYGLGVADRLPEALARLRALKGRDADKPFQLLVADLDTAHRVTGPRSPAERRIAERCWPGPLTLILPPRAPGDPTVGVRIPAHPFMLAALRRLGRGVWATSANPAGQPPFTVAADVAAWGRDALAFVADGPVDAGGLPSTVARVDNGVVTILRRGALDAATLTAAAFPE